MMFECEILFYLPSVSEMVFSMVFECGILFCLLSASEMPV
jgi:hypothetical protein